MPPGYINEMRSGDRVIAMFRAGASIQRYVWLHGAPSVEEIPRAGCLSDFVSHTLLKVKLSLLTSWRHVSGGGGGGNTE